MRPLTEILIGSLVVIVSEIRHHSFAQCYITVAVKLHIKQPCLSQLSITVQVATENPTLGAKLFQEVCDTLLCSLVGLALKRKVSALAVKVAISACRHLFCCWLLSSLPEKHPDACIQSSSGAVQRCGFG